MAVITVLASTVYSQSKITLVDAGNGDPVEGALVTISVSNAELNLVSGDDGSILVSAPAFPLRLTIRHLNYELYQATYQDTMPEILMLEPARIQLNEVVVIGQYEPQSASNSVYKVRTISRERIDAQAASNIADLLTNEMNVRISHDLTLGSSNMSLQGISGQNVKVLIDGVPVIGRTGSEIDLSQLSTQSIEKIEVVEGPMAVSYGSNALAGVINIITRKSSLHKIDLGLTLQEESAGREYDIDKGLHNMSLTAGYNISDKWYAGLDLGRNFFGGFQGAATGRNQEWDPKTQVNGSAIIKFSPGSSGMHYRLDFLDETIRSNADPVGLFQPIALDEVYHSNRYIHQVQGGAKIPVLGRFNGVVSFSDYRRIKTQYAHNLVTGEKPLSTASGGQDTSWFKTWIFRGSVVNGTRADRISWETGYDINIDHTGGGRILDGLSRSIGDYAIFASAEIIPVRPLKIRPGLRWAYNTVFEAPLVPSLNLKCQIAETADLRFSYGKGFRAPTLRELYFEFIDSNHRIFGNENLSPENSDHLDFSYTLLRQLSKSLRGQSDLDVFYNSIRNQITYGQSVTDPSSITFINVNKFKSWGANVGQKFIWPRFTGQATIGFTGRFNELSDSMDLAKWEYSPEVSSRITYSWSSRGMQLSLFYKYTGKVPQYALTINDQGEQEAFLGRIDDYHWMDLTVRKDLWNHFSVTAGIKNIFNVTNISATALNGGGHSSGDGLAIGYGRSIVLRLTYKLNP
ncbi:MAG TPA: TonB-dependent receptor [Cyclobacteriaceae bacterium]|nr:TonB-dependent receptor [Cyclobacteriaceae bacterium]